MPIHAHVMGHAPGTKSKTYCLKTGPNPLDFHFDVDNETGAISRLGPCDCDETSITGADTVLSAHLESQFYDYIGS